MTETAAKLQELLTKRLEVVAKISAANADHLRLLQIDGAADIDIASGERDIAEAIDTAKTCTEIIEAKSRKQDARREIDLSEARIEALEAEMEAIDKEIDALSEGEIP